MSFGIIGYGAYVPSGRIKVEDSAAKRLKISQRSVAGEGEDTITMAVEAAKQALYHGLIETDLEVHMNYELYLNAVLTETEDYEEGVKSFLEKREPQFKGR